MKILLIDDHQLFAKSIKMILELDQAIEKAEIVSNINSLDFPLSEKYDVILMDINLSTLYKSHGLALAEEILIKDPECVILILTGYAKYIYEQQAIEIGASGFVDKSIEPEKLISIIKKLKMGKSHFTHIKQEDGSIDRLSDREVEILQYIKEGNSVDVICQKLFISKRTFSNHMNHILSKLSAANRQEAVFKAEKLGYFEPG
ncbi:response regulator transcription factor [Atopobacter phocae]|uniref:response regulator transcription factor n=1 Tax=Atopobacter phocae TaxID=136492 RepID=UPI000470BB53|nr:response regulator transcription factor [Atopobacter phocae]